MSLAALQKQQSNLTFVTFGAVLPSVPSGANTRASRPHAPADGAEAIEAIVTEQSTLGAKLGDCEVEVIMLPMFGGG